MTTPLGSKAYPADPTMPKAAPSGFVTPTKPANPGKFEPPMTSSEVESRRVDFIELILRQIVKALTGFFLPGSGSAFSQLGNFAAGIPIIGPIVQAITGVIGGTIETIGNFFGNLLGFLPGNFNEPGETFNPIAMAVDFIFNILNPSNLLGGLFSPGLIPGMDGSKVTSGQVNDNHTGVQDLRDYISDGLNGATGLPGNANEELRLAVDEVNRAAASGALTAAQLSAYVSYLSGQENSNGGVGGVLANPLDGVPGTNGAALP